MFSLATFVEYINTEEPIFYYITNDPMFKNKKMWEEQLLGEK